MLKKACILVMVVLLCVVGVTGGAWGVAIDAANFPDASFRSHVKQYDTGWTEYDSNGEAHWVGNDDGFLDWPEIERVTGMNAFRHSSVKGIEYFTMLDTLGVNGNDNYADGPGETFLTEVNVSTLHHLGLFNCFHNRLNALDVSQNPELWSLLCFDNNIKNLNVSHNPKLRILMCDQNPLGQLNVSNNTQLENLRCYRNELKELNVRNNPALSVLYCFDNKISKLDISNNPEMEELQCHNNPLGELDVSHNLKLKYLFCGSNDLRELDVTNNQSLMTLHCWSNHLTELDLSKNTRLTEVLLGVQEADGLKVKAVPEGYEVCLNDYVSDVNNIDPFSVGANDYSLKFTKYSNDGEKATVIFPEPPQTLHYRYNTHSPNNDQLYVIVKRSMNVDVIERGAGAIDNLIICGVADDHYVARGNVPVTENKIASYSPKIYGKKGFVADGNSRLIVRVKTERPGNVEFSVKENIGVEVERLSDRAKVSSIHTTDIGGEEHQASAVLVAPEMYPAGNFPSQDFTVHVKFTADETGEEIPEEEKIMESDIELEIHAAPVLLIHSFGTKVTAENTFSENGSGVLPVLKENGFKVFPFNYDGNIGVKENLGGMFFNSMFNDIFYIFEQNYIKKGIICTKIDMVAHGMGGLMARRFCLYGDKNLLDGNYYTARSYGQGMARRIITIATPHRGTLWGNAMMRDWGAIINPSMETIGMKNMAYVALKALRGGSSLTNLGFGWGENSIPAISSAWKDVAVMSDVVNGGFPVNVPMYSIYGKTKDIVDAWNLVAGLADFIGVWQKAAGAFGKVRGIDDLGTRTTLEFLVGTLDEIKAIKPLKKAKLEAVQKEFKEIKEAIREQNIVEALGIFLKDPTESDYARLIEMLGNNDILKSLEKDKLRAVAKKYASFENLLKEVAPDLNEYLKASGKITGAFSATELVNDAFAFRFREINELQFPSWFTKLGNIAVGASEVISVAAGGLAGAIGAIIQVPFAVMDLIFGNEDHDLMVSEASARDYFGDASAGMYGWRYRHDKICKQDDVGISVMNALKVYPKSRFKIFGADQKILTANSLPTVKAVLNMKADSEEDEIEIDPEKIFETHFELSAESSTLSISDSGYVVFTASSDTPVSDDVCLVFSNNDTDTLIPMYETSDITFEIILKFDSVDAGAMSVYCFSKGNEDNVYISNTVKLTVKPKLGGANLEGLYFADNDGVIFTDASSDIPAGLIAQTSDDFTFDVSSPLMGTVWTSSNPSAAYVTDDGMIHSLADGSTTLTASYAGLTANLIVNVGNESSPPEITLQALDGGNVGKNYTAQLQASGTPVISWRTIDGRLPFDLTLSESGTISGYPSEEGTFTFTAEASNIFGTDSKDFTITISNASDAALMIDSEHFHDDVFRAFISENLDWNHDGFLTEQEISGVTAIDVSNMGIKSLKGIEYFTSLVYLTCTNNELKELDLSQNMNIYGVACQNNKLESINLANSSKLFQIWLDNNNLTSVDFTGCPELNILSCKGNKITTLNLSYCRNITELQCDEGVEILYSDTSGGSELLIDANNFPDEIFRKFIADNFDWDKNGSLSDSEIAGIRAIDVTGMGIATLRGIEHFPALEYLSCSSNDLTELDISQNVNMKGIACDNNRLEAIDLTHCPELVQIWFSYNRIASVNLTYNPRLKIVYLLGNMLTELDISGNPELEEIGVHENKLTKLDVSSFAKLRELHCGDNLLETLMLGDKPGLLKLYCYRNNLKELNLNGCPVLKELSFGGNKLSAIDITNCTELESLAFWDNFVTELNIASHVKLKDCIFGNNRVKTLNIGRKPELLRLHCYSNDLSAVDITKCPVLQDFSCEGNKISILDVTKCKELEGLYCRDNLLKVLDLSECPKITKLTVDEGVKLIYTHEEIAPEILTESLTNAITAQPYTHQLTASGTTPITWTLKGRLPQGLTLSPSGLISGTPQKAGKFTFTVQAANDYGSDTHKFTLQVLDPANIITASLKPATFGKSYSVTLKAKGSKPLSWSATGLPDGLTINAKTGRISGKPSAHGKFNVKITASNEAGSTEKSLQLAVKGVAPKLSGSLARATINEPYSSGLRLTAGTYPLTWSCTGTLPAGLTFDTSTGKISGTPTSYEKSGFRFTITASNDEGRKSKSVRLNVKAIAPKITVKKLPDAEKGKSYTVTLTATGSTPITWKADGLPEGLYVDGSTIRGTPKVAGDKFTVTLYAENPVKSVKKSLTLKVASSSDTRLPVFSKQDGFTSFTDDVPAHEYSVRNVDTGYVIVAELGEISCDISGMYDFSVTLSDDADIGAELVYMAGSDVPSDDDDIAEFYDETGEEVTCVPESRRITLSVWMNEGVIYSPVIAVKK